ncbi:class F sortase [Kitasatospora arboriphila]
MGDGPRRRRGLRDVPVRGDHPGRPHLHRRRPGGRRECEPGAHRTALPDHPGRPRDVPLQAGEAAHPAALRRGPLHRARPHPDRRPRRPAADDRNLVGWYKDGPTPGERGPAVVAGHVDTTKGPAVFLMLYVLRPGNPVEVTRADGSVAVFTVDSVQTFAKNAFPDQLVYGDTPDAQLRLITCAGEYNRATHDYADNVVVFAHLSSTRLA